MFLRSNTSECGGGYVVERWKPVFGYEDLYQVSDQGRVRRVVGGSGTYAGRVLRLSSSTYGYSQVCLSRNSCRKHQSVHTLVARAFLGPRPAGLEVNHKNGIKRDNRVSNLEYVTHGENMKHSRDVLGNWRGEANGRAKLTDVMVRQIRRSHAEGGITQRALAKQYRISEGQMSQILRRKKWSHVV
jgi:hypothetical protein